MIALSGAKYGGYVLENGSLNLYDENNEIVDTISDFTFNGNILIVNGWKYIIENDQAIFSGIE